MEKNNFRIYIGKTKLKSFPGLKGSTFRELHGEKTATFSLKGCM